MSWTTMSASAMIVKMLIFIIIRKKSSTRLKFCQMSILMRGGVSLYIAVMAHTEGRTEAAEGP
jgi:hypothetical protein